MFPYYAIQSKSCIYNDINYIYLSIKFQTSSPKNGLDIEVNVWKPGLCRFLQHLITTKVLIEYGCKHIAKIFQSYKRAIKCKFMFWVKKLVQFRKEKITIVRRSKLSFVKSIFFEIYFCTFNWLDHIMLIHLEM